MTHQEAVKHLAGKLKYPKDQVALRIVVNAAAHELLKPRQHLEALKSRLLAKGQLTLTDWQELTK